MAVSIAEGREARQTELLRFGVEWPEEFVPLNSINVCGQQRRDFDEEPLEVLGNSIAQQGQFHPLLVMRMLPEMAERYVEYTNECWVADVDFSTFVRREDGYYDILDAGERRLRAMRKKEEEQGLPPGTYGVDIKVRTPTTIAEVIKIQFDENLSENVPPQQEAKAIRQAYFIGKKEGLFQDVQSFVKFCSLKEDATRNALRYFELPTQVRGLVEEGVLSYSMAVELAPMMRVAYEYYTRRLLQSEDVDGQLQYITPEHAIASAQEKVYAEAVKIVKKLSETDKKERWTRNQVRRHITGTILAMQGQGSFDEMTLKSAAGIEADQRRAKQSRLENIKGIARNLAHTLAVLHENGIDLEVDLPADFDPVKPEQQILLNV